MLTLAQELKAELLDYEDDEEELADTVNHHALEAVRSAGNGFVLSFSSSNGAPKEVKADIAVLTVPFSVLRHTDLRVELPPLKKQAIAELGYGTNAKIIAGFH